MTGIPSHRWPVECKNLQPCLDPSHKSDLVESLQVIAVKA
jgi:hypothetical protein